MNIQYYEENVELLNLESRHYNDKIRYLVVIETNVLEGYNVVEGHFTIRDAEYLDTCKEITKDEYIKATKGWYTPEEYL